ncbi:rop guanine nucleotide exchange factor 12 [Mercurialis annua]|uniref:rop guanine nucleotide exchange factor 12 n=1 Tax=Mercurialis annua TaxID=3986 RepID=UPI00215E2696|nr:rop guanine nucleotide exchange factor 12 [Mercurialis annua]
MVRALEQEQENYRSRLFRFKEMSETSGGRSHSKSHSVDDNSVDDESSSMDDKVTFRSQGSRIPSDPSSEKHQIGSVLHRNDKGPKSRLSRDEASVPPLAKDKQNADMDQMKERFAKLLLGEDMSGGGKGVTSALALSNATTNLAASVFGEQHRLEPMSVERKARWRKEIDWLLSVSDYIVELVPSQQKNKDGTSMEIMVTRQRTDLHMNIPALRKLDAMLIDCLDNFRDQNEFTYISKDAPDSEKGSNKRKDDKWWLPTAKVPPNGLSEGSRKFLQYQKDCVNQVLKAAMAINAQVLSEMEIPENYIESLPKNGRASLGDSNYKSITVEFFDPDQFLSTMDLSSEHKILDLKNRIEASIVIWKRKMNQKDGKSAWGSAVSLEKRELFEERAETILLILKQKFPGIPQSALDISKIQYNEDVGQALLESYSRILESLAYTVMSRIEDVLYADYVTRNPSYAGQKRNPLKETPLDALGEEFARTSDAVNAMTLSDFMGWNVDSNEAEANKNLAGNSDELVKDDMKLTDKLANIVTLKKPSYLENLGGLRSPTARH